MREIGLQKLIVEWLNANGHAAFINEIPQGMISKYSPTGYRKTMNKSSADIVGSLKPNGRAIFIECKLPKHRKKVMNIFNQLKDTGYILNYHFTKENKHILDQANFLLWQRKAGALAFFAFSLEDVQRELDMDKKGYHVYSPKGSELSLADRKARKAPKICMIIKKHNVKVEAE